MLSTGTPTEKKGIDIGAIGFAAIVIGMAEFGCCLSPPHVAWRLRGFSTEVDPSVEDAEEGEDEDEENANEKGDEDADEDEDEDEDEEQEDNEH